MTEQETRNRKLAASLLTHYARNDHAGMRHLLTDDCEFRIGVGKSEGIVPYHGRHVGHDEIGAYLQKRRQHSMRDECILSPPGQNPAPRGGGGTEPEPATGTPDAGRQHDGESHPVERFLVHGDTVVAIGHLKDKFANSDPMHDTDFVLVFRIDETQGKICFFQYFFDTAAAVHAWRGKR